MKRGQRNAIIAASLVFAAVLAALLLRQSERYPATDDAYVDADVVGIVAQVAGPIVKLPVADNQAVRAGELLFEIDPRPFRIEVEQARAELDRTGLDVTALADAVTSAEAGVRYAEAQLRLAETQWRRVEPLSKIGAVPFQDRDKAQAALDGARAGLENAEAELAQARANLGEADANNPDIRAAVAQLHDFRRVLHPLGPGRGGRGQRPGHGLLLHQLRRRDVVPSVQLGPVGHGHPLPFAVRTGCLFHNITGCLPFEGKSYPEL